MDRLDMEPDDRMVAAVTAAPAESYARLITAEAHRDEDAVVWFQPTTIVSLIGHGTADQPPGVVLADIFEG